MDHRSSNFVSGGSSELNPSASVASFFVNSQNKLNRREQDDNPMVPETSTSTPSNRSVSEDPNSNCTAHGLTVETTSNAPIRNDRRYRCSHCTKLYLTLVELVKHQKKHRKPNNLGNNPYSPNESLMLMSDRSGLVSTVISETNDGHKQYKCSNCSQAFTNFLTLTRHLNYNCLSIGADRAYNCPYCTRVFSGLLQLKTHIPTHTKTYKCALCGKALSRYSRLRGHCVTPSGQSTFNCEDCNRPLGQNDIFCAASGSILGCADRLRNPSPKKKKTALRKSIRV